MAWSTKTCVILTAVVVGGAWWLFRRTGKKGRTGRLGMPNDGHLKEIEEKLAQADAELEDAITDAKAGRCERAHAAWQIAENEISKAEAHAESLEMVDGENYTPVKKAYDRVMHDTWRTVGRAASVISNFCEQPEWSHSTPPPKHKSRPWRDY